MLLFTQCGKPSDKTVPVNEPVEIPVVKTEISDESKSNILTDDEIVLKNSIPADGYYIDCCTNKNLKYKRVEYSWKTSYPKQHSFKVYIDISIDDIDAAELCDTKAKSMTTTDMGIEQETNEFAKKIETAISEGRTEDAQKYMKELDNLGSFYSREWKAYHPILYKQAQLFIDTLYNGLNKIAVEKKMNDKEKLYFFISFVQNIKYDGMPGISSPITVLSDAYGACAAKSYLLFLILRKNNIDCKIIGSQTFNHMVLGINIPTGGSFKTINSTKYYFLETTYPDWNIGKIKPEWNQPDQWELIDINI